ncbi:MAG: glutaredoxin [Opitutales bacterium]|nr:glutaredoxin [Opitutales bacterium]
MKIEAYLKPHCGWSHGVRTILSKYGLDYVEHDIANCPRCYEDMVRKSGQKLSPCVQINGVMLAGVSGEEVENYLLRNELVSPVETRNANLSSPYASESNGTYPAFESIRFF